MENEDYYNRIKKMSFEEYWKRVETSGWLEYIDKSKIPEMKDKTKKEFLQRPQLAYTCLSQYVIIFESGPEEMTPYIEDMARISNGQFSPTNIIEKYLSKEGRDFLQFTFNKKVYDIERISMDNLIHEHDAEVMLVNLALKENKIECRFNLFPYVESEYYYVYMPPRIFKKAQELGIIPPSDGDNEECYYDFLMEIGDN